MCVCVYFNSKMENINLFTLHFSDRYEFYNLLIFKIKLELQYSGIPLLIHSDNHNNKWTCFGGQKWKKRPLTSPFVRRSTPVSKSSAVVPGHIAQILIFFFKVMSQNILWLTLCDDGSFFF